MRTSIIIPCFNNLHYTIQCITAVRNHTKNFELILVDDLSTDGTRDYLINQSVTFENTRTLLHDQNLGFPNSINTGIKDATGEYVVLLNNDAIVTPGWLESMLNCFNDSAKFFKGINTGMVGPVSNYAGGEQGIQHDKYSLDQLDSSCIDHRKQYKDMMTITGFLSGFCVVIKREVIDKVGFFDTRFKHGFWEDNDFCLRAQLAGYNLIIDQSTFIHHFGSASFKLLQIDPNKLLRSNQLRFYSKYYTEIHKTLTTVIRSHNQASELYQCIKRASDFSDKIIVLLDRCTDDSYQVCKSFSLVDKIIEMNKDFNEPRDRQLLLDTAIDSGADWILSLDSDEIFEDAFTYSVAHSLIKPLDPQILAYGINFKTYFLGTTHYRTDGIFGQLWGTRLWKAWKGQKIQSDTKSGLHCTHGPPIPQFNLKRLRFRVKHYGYDSIEKCHEKFSYYTKIDPEPNPIKTSPEGYKHIVSESISLNTFHEKNDISLCMLASNEEEFLFSFLSRYYPYFDQIVVVDTGSTDKTKDICNLFKTDYYRHKWKGSFSEARNFAKSKCSCKWIFSMDPDEVILEKDLPILWDMLEENVDCWMFKFLNYQKDNSIVYSDNVRLFRNIPQIYWSWRVHENMAPAITKHKLQVLQSPFNLIHYGFLKEGKHKNRKLIQYGKLLEKQIKEYPNEALGYFHLAFHKFEEGKRDRGMELLKKSASLSKGFFLAHKELGLQYLKISQGYFKQALSTMPELHYYHKWLAELSHDLDQLLNRSLKE
jgi:GT2 family glycosyltransferase